MHSMAEGFAVRRIPIGMHQGESAQALCDTPRGSQGGLVRIRPRFQRTITAYRETPQSGPLGLPAPLSGEPRENMYSGRGSV